MNKYDDILLRASESESFPNPTNKSAENQTRRL